jgi:hypothetical protein
MSSRPLQVAFSAKRGQPANQVGATKTSDNTKGTKTKSPKRKRSVKKEEKRKKHKKESKAVVPVQKEQKGSFARMVSVSRMLVVEAKTETKAEGTKLVLNE